MVLLGLHGVADLGTMPADHRFPEDARAHPLGSVSQHIDKDIAHRYAEVSGDWAAHHFDIEVGAGSRFRLRVHPRPVHDGDLHAPTARPAGRRRPGRVARVAVRFASPTPLDSELTVNAYGINENSFAFEAAGNGIDHHHPRKIGTAAMSKPEIGVYLPQMGFTYDQILHRTLRCETAGHRLAVALRPPLRARSARLSLAGGLDPGDRAAQPHRAHPGRTHGAVQPIPSPRGAGEDGHDARPDLGGPASTRHRQRFDRRRAQPGRTGLGNVRRALRTARARRWRFCIRRSPTR